MTPYIRNNQNHLAEEHRRFENYLLQESRIALLKIQSWQFAMKTPEVGAHYQQEATEMVKKSLLDRKSTRLNSSHCVTSRMPSSA